MNDLPIEKQLTHMVFCRQVETLDLETAKILLTQLHLLYLSQQAMFVKLAKQEIGGISNE